MTDQNQDLNQIITHAVNARIEAHIASALAGDEVIGKFVQAALMQQVDHKPDGRLYGRTEKVTFLHKVLLDSITKATKAAAEQAVADEQETIRTHVREALGKRMEAIADGLVNSFADGVKAGYNVDVKVVARDRD